MDRNVIVQKARALFFARQNEKTFKEEAETLATELKDALPNTDKSGELFDDIVITITDASNSRLDMAKLCEFFKVTEKDLEQFKVTSTYRKITVSRPATKK